VSLASNGSRVELRVSDDGAGLPSGFVPEDSETLGMQLVVNLVTQLHGEFEVRTESGTAFIISFGV
jgi:two-component sensor histidine kinase